MIKVTVRLFAVLREKFGWKERKFELRTSDLSTLLTMIRADGEDIFNLIVDKDRDSLLPRYKIMVNGRDIEFLGGLKTKLNTDDIIAIFPPAGGG